MFNYSTKNSVRIKHKMTGYIEEQHLSQPGEIKYDFLGKNAFVLSWEMTVGVK